MKQKIRCKNCGTVIKETDFSCPICHMKPERTEEEVKQVEDNIIHKKNSNNKILKIVIVILLVAGIVLTTIGIIHMTDMTYCMSSNCSTKNLFMILVGATLTLASIITLFRFRNK